jgi:hypothetical protein
MTASTPIKIEVGFSQLDIDAERPDQREGGR